MSEQRPSNPLDEGNCGLAGSTQDLTAHGVSREDFCDYTLVVFFNRKPTDNELRWLHDHLRKGLPHRYRSGVETCVDCDFNPGLVYD